MHGLFGENLGCSWRVASIEKYPYRTIATSQRPSMGVPMVKMSRSRVWQGKLQNRERTAASEWRTRMRASQSVRVRACKLESESARVNE